MGTEKGWDNHDRQKCAWKLMVCKGRKEERKERKVAGEIALQMDGWMDGWVDGWVETHGSTGVG